LHACASFKIEEFNKDSHLLKSCLKSCRYASASRLHACVFVLKISLFLSSKNNNKHCYPNASFKILHACVFVIRTSLFLLCKKKTLPNKNKNKQDFNK